MRLLLVLALATACSGEDSEADGGGDSDADSDADSDGDTDTGTETGTGTALVESIEDHGVTWTFESPVLSGRFVTGDSWIVCPATVTAIDPAPAGGRNGSVVNLPAVDDRTGFDDRTVEGRYDPSLVSTPPIALVPGDRLVSSISVDTVGTVENWLREGSGETSESPVASVSVLTCLAEPAPDDAFRPAYVDPDARLYRLSDLDRSVLPGLAPPSAVDAAFLDDLAARMSRPWIDNLFFAFDAQVDTMPMYGREMGRVAGMASLLLLYDLPADEDAAQERLLVGFVQRGIDLWGLVRAGHPGWAAFGGHGSGRKWPIVFAGLLLGDAEMASPSTAFPQTHFGEDMHTSFVADLAPPADQPTWWNAADVVYTGHMGVSDGVAVSGDPAWGPYEHLPPDAWLSDIGESYRRCCTSLAWVGEALAARLVGAEDEWGHDAFFAYVDRWMDPTDDDLYTQEIFDLTGLDYRADWAAHGQAWDPIVDEAWATYR